MWRVIYVSGLPVWLLLVLGLSLVPGCGQGEGQQLSVTVSNQLSQPVRVLYDIQDFGLFEWAAAEVALAPGEQRVLHWRSAPALYHELEVVWNGRENDYVLAGGRDQVQIKAVHFDTPGAD